MNEERIDFSALDPSQDAARWQRLTASVVARAVAARRRRLTVGTQLLAWARPALAIAAGLCLASWAGALAHGRKATAVADPQVPPAYVLARWAVIDERPTAAKMWQVLGASDVAH